MIESSGPTLAEQATYLALASETPQGRASRVGIIKAYKELLAQFERVVTQPLAIDYQAKTANSEH
jgi:hypothetical protein